MAQQSSPVRGHLLAELGDKVDRRLDLVFTYPDPANGLEAAKRLAAELKADHPDAAASLLEGLEDMFAIRRLGVGGNLAEMLTCTNAIEPMISLARPTMRNVKNWRDGEMKKRWVAGGCWRPDTSSGASAATSRRPCWSPHYTATPVYLAHRRATISGQPDQVGPLPKFNKQRDILIDIGPMSF